MVNRTGESFRERHRRLATDIGWLATTPLAAIALIAGLILIVELGNVAVGFAPALVGLVWVAYIFWRAARW